MTSTRILPAPVDLTFRATGEVVEDLEALCRGAMGAEKWPIHLEPCDNEELLTFLLGECVVQERRYRRLDGIIARPWLFQRLRWRSRDWRDVYERHRTLPELGGITDGDGVHVDADDLFAGDTRRSGLGGGAHGSPGEVAGDRGDPGTDALRGLLESGDRALLREVKALGLGPPPGVRGSTPEAQRRLARLDRERRRRVEELKLRPRPADRVAA